MHFKLYAFDQILLTVLTTFFNTGYLPLGKQDGQKRYIKKPVNTEAERWPIPL